MSPYDYNDDAFWREREKETIVTDVRHNFAFVFQQVVMIHKFYYTDSNLSTKAEEVMEAAKKMFEKEQLSEYLYENLLSAYKQYPTMLIGNLKELFEVGTFPSPVFRRNLHLPKRFQLV